MAAPLLVPGLIVTPAGVFYGYGPATGGTDANARVGHAAAERATMAPNSGSGVAGQMAQWQERLRAALQGQERLMLNGPTFYLPNGIVPPPGAQGGALSLMAQAAAAYQQALARPLAQAPLAPLPTAPFWRRCLAEFLDLMLVSFVMVVSTTELWNAITVGVDDAADVDDIELFILTHLDAALSYSYVAKFYGFYFLYGALLTWLFGATIGKGLLGLRVIMIGTQRKPTKLASIGRQAIKTLLLLVASLLCFLCILPGGATLHDRLCSTQVIVAPRFHPRQQTR
eukprot:m.255577 g.255577  ORF g.255577 m.255577 type:complete len:284 (+) comp19162_c1_seq7:775-1626(+)